MRPLDLTFLTSSVGVWEGCTAFRNSKELIGECEVLSAKDEKRGVYRHWVRVTFTHAHNCPNLK